MIRKECKKAAKAVLRKHYLLLVIVCLIFGILGLDYVDSVNGIKSGINLLSSEEAMPSGDNEFQLELSDVLEEVIRRGASSGGEISEALMNFEKKQSARLGGLEIGRSRGVLANMVNTFTSGKLYVTVFSGILNIVGSDDLAIILFMVLVLLLAAAIWVLLKNVYTVIARRAVLESRVYESVPASSFLYLLRVGKWLRVAFGLLYTSVLELLWALTLVGFPIKYYAYYLVPYILSENPSIGGRRAVTLSRRMMKGHKWELFKMDLSFIGWDILSSFSFGLVGIFFAYPYMEVSRAEYYVRIRAMAKEAGVEDVDLLNDDALYEKVEKEKLERRYADILEMSKRPVVTPKYKDGIARFFADVFGVVLNYNKDEMAYRKSMREQQLIESEKAQAEGRQYPLRLHPLPFKKSRLLLNNIYYLRHYTLGALILMFFAFMMVGWFWEVSLHLVKDGVFVNRGTMHGPWLPIYGAGCVMILVLLNKFRKKPLLELVAAIVLCGIVEYFTSYYLEIAHNGMKWWDYTGYFLNINGRVCLEGLSIFGFGGIAVVYIAAPLLDNQLERLPRKVMIPLCVALILAFVADFIYSKGHPNAGKGITDYDEVVAQEMAADDGTVPEETPAADAN